MKNRWLVFLAFLSAILGVVSVVLLRILKENCCDDTIQKPYNTLKLRVDKVFKERSEDKNFTGKDLVEELGEPIDSIESLFGMSVDSALEIYRLIKVEKMLCSTDDTISCIAETAGFSTPQKMYRPFKNEYGVSPSQYRENHRG